MRLLRLISALLWSLQRWRRSALRARPRRRRVRPPRRCRRRPTPSCRAGRSAQTGTTSCRREAVEVLEMEVRVRSLHARERHRCLPRPGGQRRRDHRRRRAVGDQGNSEMDSAREACQHIYQQGGPPEADGDTAGWEKIVPGGDCECADGSEFAFWERRADPTKVVLYLEGGGACWTAEMCAFTGNGESTFYNWNIRRRIPRPGAGSSTSPSRTTRSPTTRSCTCRTAPATCISATPPVSTRRS